MPDDRKLALMGADRHRLVRAAARLVGAADAEDSVQDAYLRALEAEAVALHAAQAWLLTVVRHAAIDQLRRREWMRRWIEEWAGVTTAQSVQASAESVAAQAQEARRALGALAACLAPPDGAAVLLHEVFEASHADIALATGRSEAASRQQLRRALLRLRQGVAPGAAGVPRELDADERATFCLYLQSLQMRDPQALWAILGRPPVAAAHQTRLHERPVPEPVSRWATEHRAGTSAGGLSCVTVQANGGTGMAVTLDGVVLCVLPLGLLSDRPFQAEAASYSHMQG